MQSSDSDSDFSYPPPPQKKKYEGNQQPPSQQLVQQMEDQSSSFEGTVDHQWLPTDGNTTSENHLTVRGLEDAQQASSSSLLDVTQPSTSAAGRQKNTLICYICGFYSDVRGLFFYHMNLHTGAKPFKCTECPQTFPHPTDLRQHRKTHVPQELKCKFCPKVFAFKQARDKHMNTHVIIANTLTCHVCSMSFANLASVRQHHKTHFPPQFKCDFCPKMFRTKDSRNQHMNIHTGAKPFKCDQCHQGFNSRSGLFQHGLNKHSGPK